MAIELKKNGLSIENYEDCLRQLFVAVFDWIVNQPVVNS